MENKINIAEILRNCPQGMELNCTICNGVKFIELDRNPNFPIVVRANNGYEFSLTKYGQVHNIDDARCVIYPKGKTTWEGFVPPCKFKDGDIVANQTGKPFILKSYDLLKNNVCSYCGIDCWGNFRLSSEDWTAARHVRYATEEEKAKLFDSIKANGYRWNTNTKTLEIVPKFKVGDKIVKKNSAYAPMLITTVGNEFYYSNTESSVGALAISEQDNYELVPDKFDLNTLKSFESSVLIRNSKDQYWIPAFWGYKAKDGYVTTFGHSIYCIPFEGNEHLLKTKNDCDKYFKTWE